MRATQRPGMSVIEVLVALGMASILIFSVGNLVSATHRLDSASAAQEKAVLLAQQQLEQLASYPKDLATASLIFIDHGAVFFQFDTTSGSLVLNEFAIQPSDHWFTMSTAGIDPNVQNITSFAEWTSGSFTHQEKLSTIMTDWKNLGP